MVHLHARGDDSERNQRIGAEPPGGCRSHRSNAPPAPTATAHLAVCETTNALPGRRPPRAKVSCRCIDQATRRYCRLWNTGTTRGTRHARTGDEPHELRKRRQERQQRASRRLRIQWAATNANAPAPHEYIATVRRKGATGERRTREDARPSTRFRPVLPPPPPTARDTSGEYEAGQRKPRPWREAKRGAPRIDHRQPDRLSGVVVRRPEQEYLEEDGRDNQGHASDPITAPAQSSGARSAVIGKREMPDLPA